MQMSVHSVMNTAPKAAVTLRIVTDVSPAAARVDETYVSGFGSVSPPLCVCV